MNTLDEIQRMIGHRWTVERREDVLLVDPDNALGFIRQQSTLRISNLISVSFMPGSDLTPSDVLYRWVVKTADEVAWGPGSLNASLNDDGLIDLWYQYSLPETGVEPRGFPHVLEHLVYNAVDLERSVTSLFG